jgi:SAM-dependent methyltransferase
MASHDHGHDHGPGAPAEIRYTRQFWDERYGATTRLWSGKPNEQLVAQASELPPGEALDAGCGEGADAIWLAARGWTVTAVDVSVVALERGAEHARAQGDAVAGRISWQQADLLTWAPDRGRYDLVSAQFMHLPAPAFQDMNRRLAEAVRPGGTLLIVLHHPDDVHANVGRPTDHPGMFPLVEQLADALDPADWQVVFAGAVERTVADLDGAPAVIRDNVLRATRR